MCKPLVAAHGGHQLARCAAVLQAVDGLTLRRTGRALWTPDVQRYRCTEVVQTDLEVVQRCICGFSHGLELLLPALRLGCSLLGMAQLRLHAHCISTGA